MFKPPTPVYRNIIGLDISTTIVGWCVLSSAEIVISAGHIDLTGIEDNNSNLKLFQKADLVLQQVTSVLSKNKIRNVLIETPIGMATGKNINSAIMLNKFNFMISYALYDKGYNIRYVPSQTARKKLFGDQYSVWYKLPTKEDKKEFIANSVKKYLENHVKYEKRPRATDKWKSYIYDVSDAFVVARTFYLDN